MVTQGFDGGASLPQKFRSPADLQAFYRLMSKGAVTHEAIMEAHLQATLERIIHLPVRSDWIGL